MRMTAALLLALMAAAALGAEVYTWRDASGNVHYSDTPPAGIDAKKMRGGTSSESTSPEAAPRRGLADQELEFRKRRADAESAQARAQKEKTEAEEKKRNCEQSRTQLQALESGQRISLLDAQGERMFMDDGMRAQQIERARKAVQSWCN